ncbi:hypothetical protein M5K25_011354 [Dendrobium thyrsiflorum]|uniref:Uncharacterized protein n=1 Tax=Dendrobium thyrsiflorum TaxID=117978 RepID=A0ABD0V2Z9_DENTH
MQSNHTGKKESIEKHAMEQHHIFCFTFLRERVEEKKGLGEAPLEYPTAHIGELLACDLDSGFVCDEEGRTDVLNSPFFDVFFGADDTAGEYLDRILYRLSLALEEHITPGHWIIAGHPPPPPAPANFPFPKILRTTALGVIADDTADEYLDRILYRLSLALEEHITPGHWIIAGHPPPPPAPANFPFPKILRTTALGVIETVRKMCLVHTMRRRKLIHDLGRLRAVDEDEKLNQVANVRGRPRKID